METMTKAALHYAKMGYSVYPLNGKIPYPGSHGYKDATRDRDRIINMFECYPGCNVAVATGDISGTVVIDIDPRNGGFETWVKLTGGRPKAWVTPCVLTGGGGYHLWYRDPSIRWPKQLGPGVDVQGEGRCVVAPPSIHPDTGKPYLWSKQMHIRNLSPQAMPEWLLDYRDTTPRRIAIAPPSDEETMAYLMERLDLVPRKDEYWCPCPMHSEEKMSFSINFEKGVCSCFGCGYGGTVKKLAFDLRNEA